MRPPPRSEPVAETNELRLVDRREQVVHNRLLDELVFQRGDSQRSFAPVRLGYLHPPDRGRSVRSRVHSPVQVVQAPVQPLSVLFPRHPVHARGRVAFQRCIGRPQRFGRDMVQQRRQFLLRFLLHVLPNPVRPTWHSFPTPCPACVAASRIPFAPAAPSGLAPRCSPPSSLLLPRQTSSQRASLASTPVFPLRSR